jgi:hypothetical protein
MALPMQVQYSAAFTERFWARVDKNGPVPTHRPELGPCWLWIGGKSKNGYGMIWANGRTITAHRAAYGLAYGDNPDGDTCHHCDVRLCCRPSHLFAGTRAENLADMTVKGRRSEGEQHGAIMRVRSARGERQHSAKLTPHQVREIRALYAAGGISHRALGERFGVSHHSIQDILSRKHWSHVL